MIKHLLTFGQYCKWYGHTPGAMSIAGHDEPCCYVCLKMAISMNMKELKEIGREDLRSIGEYNEYINRGNSVRFE